MASELNALILHPNTARRSRLRAAAHAMPQYGEVTSVGSVSNALEVLRFESQIQIVFISYELGAYGISSFILSAKETTTGKNCAFIVVFELDNYNGISVANNLLAGADGILLEPFSAATFDEITQLATQNQSKSKTERTRIASKLLIGTIMAEVDSRAQDIAQGKTPRPVSSQVKQACRMFRELTGKCILHYFETLFDTFDESKEKLLINAKVQHAIKSQPAAHNKLSTHYTYNDADSDEPLRDPIGQ